MNSVQKAVSEVELPGSKDPKYSALGRGNSVVQVECITGEERFAELAEQWQNLEQRAQTDFCFFQTFDWCYSWWSTVGRANPDAQLCIFVLWQGRELQAVWPMMVDRMPLGTKTLLPLTSPHAEYSNILVDKDILGRKDLEQFIDAARAHIRYDLLSLPKIPVGSPLQSLVQGKGQLAPIDEVASIFDLREFDDFAQYQANTSKSTRRNRNKRKNKLARLGHLEYRTYFADHPHYAELVAVALEMKRNWLQQTGRNDAKLTTQGLEQCVGSLFGDSNLGAGAVVGALMLDDRPVALEVGFLQNGHYYSYIGAFDWSMREHSVGKIQIEEALRWAIETGAAKYDLLAEPAGYKDSWSNNQVPLQSRVFARTFKGYLIGVMWQIHLRPKVKALFNSIPSDWRLKILHLRRAISKN